MTEPNPWTAYDERRMARLTDEERARVPGYPVMVLFHGGPRSGEPFDPTEPADASDEQYEVRTSDDGTILGAWWTGL